VWHIKADEGEGGLTGASVDIHMGDRGKTEKDGTLIDFTST